VRIDGTGILNPIYQSDQIAMIQGSSQSGRMLRIFLLPGFNQDEAGARVFDGVPPHIGVG
jgi:hypothetical protein